MMSINNNTKIGLLATAHYTINRPFFLLLMGFFSCYCYKVLSFVMIGFIVSTTVTVIVGF
jgi:hypothetical protein